MMVPGSDGMMVVMVLLLQEYLCPLTPTCTYLLYLLLITDCYRPDGTGPDLTDHDLLQYVLTD